jgi:hypothetical protein
MKNSRLWKLLRALDKKDLRDLRKFVASPIYNQRIDVEMFYDYLYETMKKEEPAPTKEMAFKVIYPKDKFNPTHIHTLTSLLFKITEQYLVWKEREQDQIAEKITLASAYRKLNLEDNFLRTIEETKIMHEAQPLRNAEYHEKNYNLLLEEFEFLIRTRKIDDNILQGIINNLDKSFISKALRLEWAINSHKAIANKEYESGILKIDEIPQNLSAPAIAIYYYGYKATKNNDEEAFKIFMSFLKNEVGCFPLHEQKDIFLIAINFCIKKINAGNEDYLSIGLDVYKDGLNKKVLIDNNSSIPRFTFANIVTFACKAKDWDWGEDFVKEYHMLLEHQYREGLYNFSLGRIYYERKNYDKALTFLTKSESKDVLIMLNAKALQTRIYYEITEMSLLHSHLNAFKIYLKRHKEIGYHKFIYGNFIKYTLKLLNINIKNKEVVEKLETNIRDEQYLYEKKWLLAQLEALK